MYIEIRCPRCFEMATDENLDIQKMSAFCKTCQKAYSIDFGVAKDIRKKTEVFAPKEFEVMKSMSELEIKIPFETNEPSDGIIPIKLFMQLQKAQLGCILLFIIVFFIGFTYSIFFQGQRGNMDYIPLIAALIIFPLVIYFLGKSLFKKPTTVISIQNNELTFKRPELPQNSEDHSSKPKPPPFVKFACENIKQLYVMELNKGISFYMLALLDKNDKVHQPLFPFFNLNHALFVEQEIERFLNIEDQNVAGEIKL